MSVSSTGHGPWHNVGARWWSPPAGAVRGPIGPADCNDCPFAKHGQPNNPVRGIGPKDPAWIIYGEGPGSNEVRRGLPFVGVSGQLLERALKIIKADRDRLWIGNAAICQPPPGSPDSWRRTARDRCAKRVRAELARFPGKPILALGAVAAQGFLGDEFKITEMMSSYWEVDIDGTGPRGIIPSVHPAAILRGGHSVAGGAHAVDLLFWSLCYDAHKVARLASGQAVKFTNDMEIEARDPYRAYKLICGIVEEARAERFVAIDVETDSLRPLEAKLAAIGLATTTRAVSVAWSCVTQPARIQIAKLLADPAVMKAGHNFGLYDRPVLKRHGMRVIGPWVDSLLQHHNAFPGAPHDLQHVATQVFVMPNWKSEFRKEGEELEDLLAYNGVDVLASARLVPVLDRFIDQAGARATYEVDLDMADVANEMHEVGVPLSRAINSALEERFGAEIERTRAELEALAYEPQTYLAFCRNLAYERTKRFRKGDPPDFPSRLAVREQEIKVDLPRFLLGSGEHIASFLKARGVKLLEQTAKGKLSTKRDILEGLHHPDVLAILEWREAAKMLSTFVLKWGEEAKRDGRFHPRWSVHKITGRWGAEAPSCQNVPKGARKKGRPNLRTQVVASRGRLFVGFDMSQLEARLHALLSGDPFLVKLFADGRDIHAELARVVWPDFDTLDKATRKELRDLVKRPEYGAMYGGEITTLYQNIVKEYPKVKLQDVARMVEVMKAQMPGIERWHQQLMREVMSKHEIRSAIFGRRRCFPLGNASITDVFNFPIQGTAAEIMATGVRRFMAKHPVRCFPILQIHDAMVFECDEADAEAVKALMVRSFTQEHTLNGVTVKFPVDAKIGKTWAEVDGFPKCACYWCEACDLIFSESEDRPSCPECHRSTAECSRPEERYDEENDVTFCMSCFLLRS